MNSQFYLVDVECKSLGKLLLVQNILALIQCRPYLNILEYFRVHLSQYCKFDLFFSGEVFQHS